MPARLVVGVVSGLLVFEAVAHLASAIRAGLHDGTRGYWIATAKRCVRSACSWNGRFVSPHGHVLLSSAQYVGRLPVGVHAGTSVAALFPGGSAVVYPPTGSDEWISLLVMLGLGVFGLYWSSHRVVANYIRQRNLTP
jgi:hypothetical protein